jgi:hypothetical protein
MGAGGSIVIDPGATCDSVCQRIMASGCAQMSLPDCISSCESFRMEFPNCMPLYEDYLVCLQTTPLVCGPNGSDPMAPQCDPIIQKLEACVLPPLPPPSFDAGMPGQCSGMVPPGPMSCAGGGGGTATGTTSGGGLPTCITDCTDRNNNTWESNCVGQVCSCRYDGMEYCKCIVNGPSCVQAPSCCPGSP